MALASPGRRVWRWRPGPRASWSVLRSRMWPALLRPVIALVGRRGGVVVRRWRRQCVPSLAGEQLDQPEHDETDDQDLAGEGPDGPSGMGVGRGPCKVEHRHD